MDARRGGRKNSHFTVFAPIWRSLKESDLPGTEYKYKYLDVLCTNRKFTCSGTHAAVPHGTCVAYTHRFLFTHAGCSLQAAL